MNSSISCAPAKESGVCGPGKSALTAFTAAARWLSIAPRRSLLRTIVPSDGRPIAFRLAVSTAICRSLRQDRRSSRERPSD